MNANKVAEAAFPTGFGDFRIYGFETPDKSDSAVVLVMGNPSCFDAPWSGFTRSASQETSFRLGDATVERSLHLHKKLLQKLARAF
jgi:GTP cyclohydrolase II